MNYFEHHIGDYDEATSHLSACEDGMYCRLIRKYYATEKPLIADVPKLQRLVRARDRLERDAVVTILEEFFRLDPDGWHHHVCDENIASYLAGEPEREVKKANEDNRTRRHREERARLFKIITDAGEHAVWNTPIADIRAMAARIQGLKPATPAPPTETDAGDKPATPVTAPVTPVTATQTPDTNPQSPVPIPQVGKTGVQHANSAPPVVTPTQAGSACLALRRAGVQDGNTSHPKLLALLAQGVTNDELSDAAGAVPEGKRKFAYVLGVVEGRRRDAAAIGQLPPAAPRNAEPTPADRAARHAEVRAKLGVPNDDQEIIDAKP